ncbi:MAG TPA: outer membrane protein assembly factor BamA [Myxococcaceae bacterium]|nr:outer membrane protein assembly factor BamA [Myxococcaceae bacterium]
MVKAIRVEGHRRVEADAIARALRTKIGQPFDPDLTDDDLRALYALGYFRDLKLSIEREADGIVYLVQVQERPVLRDIKFVGNDNMSEEDLFETIDIKPFSILDRETLRKNAKLIQEKYVEKGYYLAEVTPRVEDREGSGGAAVNVFFDIRENAKVLVKEIRFVGVEKLDPGLLRSVMAIRPGSLLSFFTNEGVYRTELLERDVAVIHQTYYDNGYINVKVNAPTVSISADKRDIYLTISVEEGEQYRIGEIDAVGDLLGTKAELLSKVKARPGQTFSSTALREDLEAITNVYYDQGYAYANISPATQVNPETREVGITFEIDKGRPVVIERINITGNTKTRDKVIRRELRIYEGELFNGTGMRRSKDRVTALGFFETVELSQKQGSAEDRVIIDVEVKEKPTGTFQVGLGFSSMESFIFTAQVQQQNFLGWGYSVQANVQASSLRQLYQLSFYDPYFLDSNFIMSTDVYRTQSDYNGFLREATGGNLTIGRYLTPEYDVIASGTFTYEYINVEPGRGIQSVPLAGIFQSGSTRSLRGSLTWDRRNNRIFPSAGFQLFGSAEIAPGFILGSDFQYARYSAYWRQYIPLPAGLVFKWNMNAGYIMPLNPERPLPISEHYFLGGINSLRGYNLFSISPTRRVSRTLSPDGDLYRDAYTGDYAVGGNKQFWTNVELEFPILEAAGLRGLLFYDVGNTYAVDERFFEDKQDRLPLGLFHSVGAGVRWFSPVGPLRFEWGFPLNRRPGLDEPVKFEFNIGNFF